MTESITVRRLCLMVDIERYREHDNRVQIELNGRLKGVLDRTLKSAEVAPNRTWHEDQGGEHLIVLPVGVKDRTVVPLLIRGLLAHLDQDRKRSPQVPLRLHVSIVPGVVTHVRNRYAGRAVVAAARLLESTAVQEELKIRDGALFALIVSDELYRDVLAQSYGDLTADDFRRVVINLPDKEWHSEAWVCGWGPGSLKPAPNRTVKALRDAVMPVAGAIPETLYDMLNPDTATEGSEHDTHETGESHEGLVGIGESATEEHGYVAYDHGYVYGEEIIDHAEYAAVDYESSDSSDHSPDELF